MSRNRVTGLPLDLEESQFELLVCERLHLAAFIADEMMVVFAVRVDRLETRRTGADVDSLDEAIFGELFESAIHTCDTNTATFGAQPVEDLLGGEEQSWRPSSSMIALRAPPFRKPLASRRSIVSLAHSCCVSRAVTRG